MCLKNKDRHNFRQTYRTCCLLGKLICYSQLEKLQQDVDRFTIYFKKQLDEIKALESPHVELYRRLLYAIILDTLAGTVLPKRPNKERFVYFVQRFCRWSDGERVSLPHLVRLLRKNPDPVFQKLREWALEKFKALPVHGSQLMSISHDPLCDDVKSMWSVQKEHRTPLEGIDLVALQHFHLLYVYRNSLIHELRTPGYGMEFGEDDEPFYHLMSTLGDSAKIVKSSVELVYPWRFLHRLCDTALDELKKYFITNELNPRDTFVFGTYWIRELNR